jgi:NTP pyrophosphatase (non-canonical NTP hydrolase)
MMDLDKYQKLSGGTLKTDDIEILTLGLLGEAGSVASSVKKIKRDNRTPDVVKKEISTELGDTLWYLAAVARYYDINLSDIAAENLAKTLYLFSDGNRDFDATSPTGQKLPQKGIFTFSESPLNGKVSIQFEGREFGDELDDNAHIDDGYRFHDVFHLAYAARLGWSPVMRKLMDRKRRYDPKLDRIEDGARAIFLEEGISVFVFNQNKISERGVSSFSDRGNIPFSVVQAIKTMTKGIEVGERSISDWFDAISVGFRCYDKLVKFRGGQITLNRSRKTVSYKALENGC